MISNPQSVSPNYHSTHHHDRIRRSKLITRERWGSRGCCPCRKNCAIDRSLAWAWKRRGMTRQRIDLNSLNGVFRKFLFFVSSDLYVIFSFPSGVWRVAGKRASPALCLSRELVRCVCLFTTQYSLPLLTFRETRQKIMCQTLPPLYCLLPHGITST